MVEEGEGGDGVGRENFESYPVTQQEFGEYVESLHSYNNSTFILQYQVYLQLSIACIATDAMNMLKICTEVLS